MQLIPTNKTILGMEMLCINNYMINDILLGRT